MLPRIVTKHINKLIASAISSNFKLRCIKLNLKCWVWTVQILVGIATEYYWHDFVMVKQASERISCSLFWLYSINWRRDCNLVLCYCCVLFVWFKMCEKTMLTELNVCHYAPIVCQNCQLTLSSSMAALSTTMQLLSFSFVCYHATCQQRLLLCKLILFIPSFQDTNLSVEKFFYRNINIIHSVCGESNTWMKNMKWLLWVFY